MRRQRGEGTREELQVQAGETSELLCWDRQSLRVLWVSKVECAGGARDGDCGGEWVRRVRARLAGKLSGRIFSGSRLG